MLTELKPSFERVQQARAKLAAGHYDDDTVSGIAIRNACRIATSSQRIPPSIPPRVDLQDDTDGHHPITQQHADTMAQQAMGQAMTPTAPDEPLYMPGQGRDECDAPELFKPDGQDDGDVFAGLVNAVLIVGVCGLFAWAAYRAWFQH
jgi:hypothetical protein